MQGKWKTKIKHIQKDKFKQIVDTKRVLKPKTFKNGLIIDDIEDYKLKQTKIPNNPMKKIYKKIASSKDRRIKRDYLNKMDWDTEIPTHKISKSILWEIV